MAGTSYKNDSDQDERLNPASAARDLYRKEQSTSAFDQIANNYGKTADDSQENANIERARQAEARWETKIQPNSEPKEEPSRRQKVVNFIKKRGAVIGLGGGGIGGMIIAGGLLGPFSLPINLSEMASLKNDSSSTVMERRFMKVFGNATEEERPECSKKSMKCKMGKISNSGLRSLSRKGVVPIIDGKVYSPGRKGYPSKNPTAYEVSMKDGTKKTILASDMKEFLSDKKNREVAAKILGGAGAFNFRVKAWTGKHISSKFYNKFNIKRDGGIADGKSGNKTIAEKIAEARSKILTKVNKVDSAATRAVSKATSQVKKAKRAGVGYTVAVGSCVAIKAPGVIAAAGAALQLAKVMLPFMNLILSPGSKAKASGVEIANSITPKDMEVIGTLLTEQTTNADGKKTSALDSPHLLAAIGVNKGKPPISKFTPGYGLLTNPLVVAANAANQKLEPACNAIMSSSAMYTAMAIDAAVTVAASATVIGGLIKVAASWAVSELAIKAAEAVVGDQAIKLLLALAENDAIPKAKGEELGDLLGISAAAFFSSGAMARHLPTLTESQLVSYNDIKQENETFHKEMDIASLSPTDISSRYTFLGSIVHNMQTAMITSGSYGNNLTSTFMSLLKMPAMALSSPIAGAATDFTKNDCGYAKEFNLETENSADTPAINQAGLPCGGITAGQDRMGTAEAIDLVTNEGWLCDDSKENCPEIPDDATIEDLMPSTSSECDQNLPETCHQGIGYIKKDTPLFDYIESCSNPQSGDYLFNAAGCVVPSAVENASQEQYNCNTADFDPREEGGQVVNGSICGQASQADFDESLPDLKNPRSLQAIAPFLIDFQVLQAMNGADEGEVVTNSSDNLTAGTPDDVQQSGEGWTLQKGRDYTSVPCASGTTQERTYSHPQIGSKFNLCKINGTSILANSLVSGNIRAMVDAAKANGTKLDGGSFRDVESQIELRDKNCAGDVYTAPASSCNPPTAKPGTSQHERGLAIDFDNCSSRDTACYQWLKNNAKQYGFYNLESEPWHWSTTGG